MMKSMAQMQHEIISQANFDGSYPKVVVLPMGIVALARDEKEWNELNKHNEYFMWFGLALMAAFLISAVVMFICLMWG